MAKPERAIFTNMCMIRDEAGNILVQNRKNPDWPGITFPGGHVEPGESFVESVIREVREETGLCAESWAYRGIVTFVSDEWGTEYMHLFTATAWEGTPIPCAEGELAWIKKEELLRLPMWEGDKIFLRLLEGGEPFFSLKLRYEGEHLAAAALNGKTIL